MLNSYGQEFMSSFDASIFTTKRKAAPEPGPSSSKKSKLERILAIDKGEDDADEWEGFGSSLSFDGEGSDSEGMCSVSSRPTCFESSVEEEDDAENEKGPPVVVFSESKPSASSLQTTSKAQLKAFMVCASRYCYNTCTADVLTVWIVI